MAESPWGNACEQIKSGHIRIDHPASGQFSGKQEKYENKQEGQNITAVNERADVLIFILQSLGDIRVRDRKIARSSGFPELVSLNFSSRGFRQPICVNDPAGIFEAGQILFHKGGKIFRQSV